MTNLSEYFFIVLRPDDGGESVHFRVLRRAPWSRIKVFVASQHLGVWGR